MLIIHFAFFLSDSTDDQTFETKPVAAQQNVTLECPREKLLRSDKLYWIRIISGHQPEFLGRTTVLDDEGVHKTPHFTTKQESRTLNLHIHQTQISDTGLYYCIRTNQDFLTFLRGVFLRVEGNVNTFLFRCVSFYIHSHCSVLSDSERKTCSEDYRVHWFRAGSHQSHPSFIYTHGSNAECGNSSQKCFYNFSKNVSVSDAGTYYCAVAACGEVMFGNGAKLDIKGQFNHQFLKLYVSYWFRTPSIDGYMFVFCCCLEKSHVVLTFVPVFFQTDEASLIYSAPTFSRRNVSKAERGNTLRSERDDQR
uniref:Ig-like domain-containing protein n=1 Tax=Salarias fasciatus TaxID=181472 RepID=A0A672IR15_SALFA